MEHIVDESFADYSAGDKSTIGDVIFGSARHLVTNPTSSVQNHLRSKADAYTPFAFLGQTPDVQGAVSKMFSHGTIWLDTTIVLPLFTGHLIVDGQRRFSQMLDTASSVGLNPKVTPGVIEEVERHINLCLSYLSMSHAEWTGNVPFLIEAYSLTVTLTPNSGPGVSSPMRPERWSYPSWPVPASGRRCSSGAVVGYRRSRCTRIAQPWPRAG